MLEHRGKKRCRIALDVVVRNRSGLALNGTTRDISTEGMFINLTSKAIAARTMVELELSPCGWLHGWVVHAGKEGIGGMFLSNDNGERCLLKIEKFLSADTRERRGTGRTD